MAGIDETRAFQPVGIAVLTISDTRTEVDDRSGALLMERIETAGHRLHGREIIPDDREIIEARLRTLVDDESADVVLTTGGTGLTGRDVTPEAVRAVISKEIVGFGEIFRHQSLSTIGLSTVQSRALGGVAGRTLIFALPGSTGACRDAWDGILRDQLDVRYRPCNFVEILPRLIE